MAIDYNPLSYKLTLNESCLIELVLHSLGAIPALAADLQGKKKYLSVCLVASTRRLTSFQKKAKKVPCISRTFHYTRHAFKSNHYYPICRPLKS